MGKTYRKESNKSKKNRPAMKNSRFTSLDSEELADSSKLIDIDEGDIELLMKRRKYLR